MRSLDFKDVICVGCHMDVIVFLIPIKKWSRGPRFYSHLSHQKTRGIVLNIPTDAIVLPLLVLHHTAWSTQKGISS